MSKVRDVLNELERLAPARYAFPFDRVGLQVGDPNQEVERAAVALDRSLGAVAFAAKHGCQFLLTHHPLIFEPLATVDTRSHVGRTVLELARQGIAFAAAHTNWDSAQGGINDTLCEIFGLKDVRPFGTAAAVDRLKLVFFCPAPDADRVIDAVSEAGAGVIGAYRRCAFSSQGTGTFIGDETTQPTLGTTGTLEQVPELRIELVLAASARRAVERALVKAHPYEQPAYDLYPLAPDPEQAAGRVGVIGELTLAQLAALADDRLHTRSWTWGDPNKSIRKVAIVGGAADNEWMNAQREGADVLLTGEVKQHIAVEATESGMTLIASGHYATEHPGSSTLKDRMAEAMPEIEWLLFTPDPGMHGRPL